MFNATFLEAKVGALAKVVRKDSVDPYPNAAQFRSHSKLITNIDVFADALSQHAAAGHCLHVGDLHTPLTTWDRRAGLANRNSELNWFVIDIDNLRGVHVPQQLDRDTLANIATTVIDSIGIPELADTSCIAHASSKMGMGGRVSMHLFFQLDSPVFSHQLKQWFKRLNLQSPALSSNIGLSSNGHALKWPLDISCADIGRLIYLAPPVFVDVADPFNEPAARFVTLHRTTPTISGDTIRNSTPCDRDEAAIKMRLRESAGLPPRERAKLRTLVVGGQQVEVLLNPASGVLRPSHTARGFCYYNLNDGDSAAYYHPEFRPDIIFNFKGEPAFRWQDIDQPGYEAYCNDHAEDIARVDPINTFMVINKLDDRVYKVWHDHENCVVTCVPSSREQVSDFYVEYGKIEPIFLPTWSIEYNPNGNFQVDYTGKTINQFTPSAIMKAGLTEELDAPLTADDLLFIARRCPTIHFLLDHLSGNDREAVGHFLNWLAVALQKRCKTETAWIFQGTEGTGKGTLYKEVLMPMFGEPNVSMRSNEDLNDAFNAWRKNKLIVCVDEFEVPNTAAGKALLGKLRNWIVEPRAAIRAMHKVGEDAALYESWILFSNQHNMLPLPEGDRRYNVCPRQERKLRDVCDTRDLYNGIRAEIATFGSLMHGWAADVDAAKICLNNSAKRAARAASRTMAEEFAAALTKGDLDFMLQMLEMSAPALEPGTAIAIDAAKRIVRSMVLNRRNQTFFSSTDMTTLYNAMFEQRMSVLSLSKMLSRQGLNTARVAVDDGSRARGYMLQMNSSQLSDDELDRIVAPNKPTLQAVQ